MSGFVKCQVCGQTTGQLKKHLKAAHGYVYTEESPNYPVSPMNQNKLLDSPTTTVYLSPAVIKKGFKDMENK